MNVLRLLPVFLSALLLGAHFLRGGQTVLVAASVAFPFLLLVARRWAARAVQAALVLGAAEWVRTLTTIAVRRSEAGEPWGRMALILGAVAALTLASALVFRSRGLRKRYFLP